MSERPGTPSNAKSSPCSCFSAATAAASRWQLGHHGAQNQRRTSRPATESGLKVLPPSRGSASCKTAERVSTRSPLVVPLVTALSSVCPPPAVVSVLWSGLFVVSVLSSGPTLCESPLATSVELPPQAATSSAATETRTAITSAVRWGLHGFSLSAITAPRLDKLLCNNRSARSEINDRSMRAMTG